MDQQSVFNEVRRSVVRIQFDWLPEEKGCEFIVITGVILSINDDGSAVILADETLFMQRKKFVVNFPNAAGGYEEGLQVPYPSDVSRDCFSTFTLRPREQGYIKPARFETRPLRQFDPIDAFFFPREGYITPAAYCDGVVVHASKESPFHVTVSFSGHSYAYLGTLLFNPRGHLVGITYAGQRVYRAWTVYRLQEMLDMCEREDRKSIQYVLDGVPVADSPMVEASVAEAPVAE